MKGTRSYEIRADRPSRVQESRDAEGVHDDGVDFGDDTGPLPNIPARPGYTQRWVRIKKGQESDSRNMYKASRQGWLPRAADTVSKSLQFMMVQREGLGGVIGTYDMVLMERREEISERARLINKKTRDDRMQAIKDNMFSENRRMNPTSPNMEFDISSRVERGKAMTVDSD